MALRQSRRAALAAQSEIRAMTLACAEVGGVNLAQGVCDLDVPPPVVLGAKVAIDAGKNTYTRFDGLPELRRAIASKQRRHTGMEVDPENMIVASIGATGAFFSAVTALLDPGDEAILFEPFYGYHVNTLLALGVTPRFVTLERPGWTFTDQDLERAVGPNTRALVLNTPLNPCGKVFTREDLGRIAAFAEAHDLFVFSDEIYEHFVYDGREHVAPATLPGMAERTITISGFSKVYAVTGWRLGYAICDPRWHEAIGHVNDLVYVCAPAPLQVGASRGLLELGPDYYRDLAAEHQEKRDVFCAALAGAGLEPLVPEGAYYALADVSSLPGEDDKARAMFLLREAGVAGVPGRAFFTEDKGRDLLRFCFAKRPHVLEDACARLGRPGLRERLEHP
jgi:aminotransferase